MAITLLLTLGIAALPVNSAWAGQTLEIPSAIPTSAPAPMTPSAPSSDPAPYTDNRPIPGMGSVGDYMNQAGDPASARSGNAPAAGGYAYNTPNDPRSNSEQLLTAALVGGAIIGLIALSNYSAHHHHR